jgi:hypothetical protein
MVRASGTDMPMPAARRLASTSGSERPIIFNSGTPLVSWYNGWQGGIINLSDEGGGGDGWS